MPSDEALLAIEIDTLWARDERGRLLRDGGLNGFPAPYCVIASAPARIATWAVGAAVPPAAVAELETLLTSAVLTNQQAVVDDCRDLLVGALGPVEVSSGPTYLVERAHAFPSNALIRTSDETDASPLGPPPEEARWTSGEWNALTSGKLGPWAVGLVDNQIVAICFCARLTDAATEAGVWTHHAFRGLGHAAAVTAAWAKLLLDTGRHVFYSTSSSNQSSQRAAARLGLRPIGALWRIGPPTVPVVTRGVTLGEPGNSR